MQEQSSPSGCGCSSNLISWSKQTASIDFRQISGIISYQQVAPVTGLEKSSVEKPSLNSGQQNVQGFQIHQAFRQYIRPHTNHTSKHFGI